jgi:hypothetical protein
MCGPLFWLLCYWLIVESVDPSIKVATYVSACRSILVKLTGVSFVDDAGLGVTSSYTLDATLTPSENKQREFTHTVSNLHTLAQHWERLLFTTGGAINLQKSFWYLMHWVWNKDKPRLATISQTSSSLHLTSGYSATPKTIPRIESTTAFRTLGVYISPSGCQKKQTEILRGHTQNCFSDLSSLNNFPSQAYLSYMLYLRPKFKYPLSCTTLTPTQCKMIQAPALAALLPKLHLNRHSPRAVIFGSSHYGGLGLPDLHVDQGYEQLTLFIGHLKFADENGQMILSQTSATYNCLSVQLHLIGLYLSLVISNG